MATEDLAAPSRLAAVAQAHARLGLSRPQGRALVQVRAPADALLHPVSRSGLVVDIVTDDMPYLVDSVTTELNRHEAEIRLLRAPAAAGAPGRDRHAARDPRRVRGRGGPVPLDDVPFAAGELTEAWIHVELGPLRDKVTADQLEAELRHVLDDVRVAVEDQPRMGAVARGLADDLGGAFDTDQAEYGELLRWLANGNFLFLGYREYDLVPTEDGMGLRAVPGTGLGILRHDRQGREAVRKISSQVARRAQDPAERLVLAKANSRSTVYRANYLDYVSVKKLARTAQTASTSPASSGSSACTRTRRTSRPSAAFPCSGASWPRSWRRRAVQGQPRWAGPGRDTRGLPARGAVRDRGGGAHPDRARRAAAERAQADQAVPAP